MGLRLITPPVAEPMTLAEIKEDLRIDHTDDDAKLTRMMKEARDWLEITLNQKLMTQTWDLILDAFPTDEIFIPFGPIQSVTQVAYDDAVTFLEVIMDPAGYFLDNTSPAPWLFPADSWPMAMDAVNSVRVRLLAGYETDDDIPASIRAAYRLKVREFYDGDDLSKEIDRQIWLYLPMYA